MVVSHHVAKVGGLFEKERILIYKIQHKSFKVVLTTVTKCPVVGLKSCLTY